MPIIKCPGCGGQLSTSAPACPRCQHVPTEEEISLATSIVGPPETKVSAGPADAILSDQATRVTRDRALATRDKVFIDALSTKKVNDIVSYLKEEGITSERELRRRIHSLEVLVSKSYKVGIGSWISMIIGAVLFIPVFRDQPWNVYDSPGVYQGMDLISFIVLFFSGLLIGIPVKNMVAARSNSRKLKEAKEILLATPTPWGRKRKDFKGARPSVRLVRLVRVLFFFLGWGVGSWLDSRLGTSPIFWIVGCFIGVGAGQGWVRRRSS